MALTSPVCGQPPIDRLGGHARLAAIAIHDLFGTTEQLAVRASMSSTPDRARPDGAESEGHAPGRPTSTGLFFVRRASTSSNRVDLVGTARAGEARHISPADRT
jgi:hypothetical protein